MPGQTINARPLGKEGTEANADSLIWHADVRRMLLTQKAIAEGVGR